MVENTERDLVEALVQAAAGELPTRRPGTAHRPMPIERPTRTGRTLRVDLDKLDRLVTQAGEIGVVRGQLRQMLESPALSREAILDAMENADLLYLELQELVMKLRMVPVGTTFRRYRRVVRDLARSQSKEARLVSEGEDVEVDTRVIEHLRDPLTHMIRNALDHGIEPPEVRIAQGKPGWGTVALRARHESGSIIIELSDDGAGLNRERIAERALDLGLVAEGEALSDREIEELLFQPGFSTAEQVDHLSGRGVGMDVVRRNIEALRGSVALVSRDGEGVTVTLRLPLTLAIIEGLQVGVEHETYVLPLDAISETLPFDEQVGLRTKKMGVLSLRGASLPYVRLRHLLRIETPPPERESLVVVQAQGARAGLVVDDLYGESQTVIKPLAKILQGIPGLSGSAILGSGRVAFILDVPGLLRGAMEQRA